MCVCYLEAGDSTSPNTVFGYDQLVSTHSYSSGLTSEILWLDDLEIELGNIEQDSAITQMFRFQNNGESFVQIDNVRTSCGCTAGDWASAPTPPGETGVVTLTFDAAKRGYFRKRATVWFKDIKRPSRLVLSGRVI